MPEYVGDVGDCRYESSSVMRTWGRVGDGSPLFSPKGLLESIAMGAGCKVTISWDGL